VSRESLRLRGIVDNLLWLARFDSEPANPANEPVDMFTIAEICADRFSAIARSREIDLSVHCEGEPQAWITAPPEWADWPSPTPWSALPGASGASAIARWAVPACR
jgi:signal transduction histidine kinase